MTGKELFKERLSGNFSGSPIVAGDLVYAAAESGEILVMKVTKGSLEVVERNATPMFGDEDIVRSSLAAVDGQILMRSDRGLFCFESK